MRLQEQIMQTARQAEASGGGTFLGPDSSLGPGPDAPSPKLGGLEHFLKKGKNGKPSFPWYR